MQVRLHPDVGDYLDRIEDADRCREAPGCLEEDPFTPRSGCDIARLQGTDRTMYRLRVGDHRFEYFIEDDSVWVVEAFRRGRGYR